MRGARTWENGSKGPGSLDFLVVEDDLVLGRQLVRALRPFGAAAACPTIAVAQELLDAGPPPLGLAVDEVLPDGSGSRFLLETRIEGWPGVGLVMTGAVDGDWAGVQSRAHLAGAFFLSKPFALRELHVFASRSGSRTQRVARAFHLVSQRARLTRRERAVLRLALEGVPRADLSLRLDVSDSTVKTTIKRLLRKLDRSSGSLQGAVSMVHELARGPGGPTVPPSTSAHAGPGRRAPIEASPADHE